MSKKLAMSPDVSYMLGVYSCNRRREGISLVTKNNDLLERFVQLAVNVLDVDPTKIMITEIEGTFSALIYNSKLKKLFEDSLGRREIIFKYANDYSANYFSAIFDCRGGYNEQGIYIMRMDRLDNRVLERLGFHTRGSLRTYVLNTKEFSGFIGKYSLRMKAISEKARLRNRSSR
ncbi:MAG: hypothetical protein KGH60_01870 [Candidatus Micrarchaeota archaeon]|nr:hypothetical protein [Candidatus Micrarchaeota archaeon]